MNTEDMLTLTCCQENIWFVWSETSYIGDERQSVTYWYQEFFHFLVVSAPVLEKNGNGKVSGADFCRHNLGI